VAGRFPRPTDRGTLMIEHMFDRVPV